MRAPWISFGAGALLVAAGSAMVAWSLPARSAATAPPSLEELAAQAVESEDPVQRELAIRALRSRGREGHEALMRHHADAIEALREGRLEGDAEALRHAVDVVSGQRDGHASGLYWYTDLAAAQRAARSSGRPILSLRLLGRLDEELSCANSRFFRIVLYSDPEIARMLREQFVLHWSSERPAPRIEIDMGDGRRMVRTITGNSAHYVLDAGGRPLDVIVGLYAPDHFRAVLAGDLARANDCRGAGDLAACLARTHRRAADAARRAWSDVQGRGDLPGWDAVLASLPEGGHGDEAPSAVLAMPLTTSKARIETPMLDLMQRGARGAQAPVAEPDWTRVAALQGHLAPLASRTRALLRLKTGRTHVDVMATELAREAAADGARNELLFRRRVHAWFASREEGLDRFETLNARVYAELMQTPASDPWLGLRADDLYDGLEQAQR